MSDPRNWRRAGLRWLWLWRWKGCRRDVAVWGRLSFGAHRRCHSSDRAIGLDGRAISVGKVPLAPVDGVAALHFGFIPGTVPDESLHPPLRRPLHQTAQNG